MISSKSKSWPKIACVMAMTTSKKIIKSAPGIVHYDVQNLRSDSEKCDNDNDWLNEHNLAVVKRKTWFKPD